MLALLRRLRKVALSLLAMSVLAGISVVATTPVMVAAARSAAECKLQPWTPKTDLDLFVYPATVNKARQDIYVDEVVSAINATPRGAIIRMSAHGSSEPEIQDALLCAIERKVDVRYITWNMDDERDGHKYIAQLRSLLGSYKKGTNEDNYLQKCKGACNTAGAGGIHHAKIVAISEVVGTNRKRHKYLVFGGSSNATPNSSSKSWQHNQLVVGDAKYYAAFRKYFDAMRVDGDHFYPSKPVKGKNWEIYFYPSKHPVNPQLELLRDITSCKAKKGSGENGRTRIDFMTFSWRARKADKTPQAIADKLVGLKRDRCIVHVAVAADKVDKSIIRTLKKGGVETYDTRDTGQFNHTKDVAVSGTVNGKAANILVSGTLNAVPYASKKSDEYLVKFKKVRSAVLKAFKFFETMKANGRRL